MCRNKRKHLNRRIRGTVGTIIGLSIIPFCIYMGNRTDKVGSMECPSDSAPCIGISAESGTIAPTHNLSSVETYVPEKTSNTLGMEIISDPIIVDIREPVQSSKKELFEYDTLPCLDSNELIEVDKDLLKYIYETSTKFNVPYEVSLAVCYVESGFVTNINNAGTNADGTTDWGIMGLNDLYLEDNCNLYNNGIMIDPYNPYENVYIGIQILSSNLKYFNGNVYDACNAYNLGPYGWEYMKSLGETWYYGDKVLDYIDTLEIYFSK